MRMMAILGAYFASMSVGAFGASEIPDLEAITARMVEARAANRSRLRAYDVTRSYRLFGREMQSVRSEVVADLSFVPPDSKQFVIHQSSGTRLGERVVRQMLEHEKEMVRDYGATDLSPANYDFRFVREEDLGGRRCFVLETLPRRKDKTLLRGQIWIDAATWLPLRSEGAPGKALSWWFRDARIVLLYSDVSGMWLQTASESTADVRFLGRFTMQSRDVEYRISEPVAGRTIAAGRR